MSGLVQIVPSEARYATYQIMVTTGTMAAGIGAASEIFQFRWTSTTKRALVHQVKLNFRSLGTGFTAGRAQFTLTVARAFTAAGTGGGTATITTNNGKLHTNDPTTALTELRIATTAALTAGTKTLDAQPMSDIECSVSNVADTQFIPSSTGLDNLLWSADQSDGGTPIVLGADRTSATTASDGVIIRTTVPATGTWEASAYIRWSEVTV